MMTGQIRAQHYMAATRKGHDRVRVMKEYDQNWEVGNGEDAGCTVYYQCCFA